MNWCRTWTAFSHSSSVYKDSETTNGFVCGGADLEPGPECEVDTIQVIVQAGYAPLVHDELVMVVDANHEQQAQDVPCFLHCAWADTT